MPIPKSPIPNKSAIRNPQSAMSDADAQINKSRNKSAIRNPQSAIRNADAQITNPQ